MAPDLNSLFTSPHPHHSLSPPPARPSPTTTTASRRASQQMPPPPLISTPARPLRTPSSTAHDQMSSGGGLPLRHPRPMTPAEVYAECEKEQEAVVNRLTRELTALRAQTASVASNASHSSANSAPSAASMLPVDISDHHPAHHLTGATHPTPPRQRRSSSSMSSRSASHSHAYMTPSTSTSASGLTYASTQAHAGSAVGVHVGSGMSQASADRAAAVAARSLSRPPSMTASGTSTPARQSLDVTRHPSATHHTLPHRPALSREQSHVSISSTAAHAGTPLPPHAPPAPLSHRSPTTMSSPATSDHQATKAELDLLKTENEALRHRIRTLEGALRLRRRDSSTSNTSDRPRAGQHQHSAAAAVSPGLAVATWADGGVGGVAGPRERSESQSTTTSSRRGMVAGEDDVRVGESAGNAGLAGARGVGV